MSLVIIRNWKNIVDTIGCHIQSGQSKPITLNKKVTVKCNNTKNKSLFTIVKLHRKHNQPLCCYICDTKPSHIESEKGTLKLVFRNGYDATIEHVIPKSKDGQDHITNYKIACYNCNRKRGNFNIQHKKLLQLYIANHYTLSPYVKKFEDVKATTEETLESMKTLGFYASVARGLVTAVSNKIPKLQLIGNSDHEYYHNF